MNNETLFLGGIGLFLFMQSQRKIPAYSPPATQGKSGTTSAPTGKPSNNALGNLLKNTNRNCPKGDEMWNARCRDAKAASETAKTVVDALGYGLGKVLQGFGAVKEAQRKEASRKSEELRKKIDMGLLPFG